MSATTKHAFLESYSVIGSTDSHGHYQSIPLVRIFQRASSYEYFMSVTTAACISFDINKVYLSLSHTFTIKYGSIALNKDCQYWSGLCL